MTITLQWHWWYWPILFIAASMFAAWRVQLTADHGGNFPDFFTPMVALAVFLLGVAGAIGAVVGHFL